MLVFSWFSCADRFSQPGEGKGEIRLERDEIEGGRKRKWEKICFIISEMEVPLTEY